MIFPKMAGFKTIQLFKHLCDFVILSMESQNLTNRKKAEDILASILKKFGWSQYFFRVGFSYSL
jgi:hypothetical protein